MMKENKIGQTLLFYNQTKKIMQVAAAFCCLFILQINLTAQCTLSCNNPMSAPANVSPDANCEVTLSVPASGFASPDCTGPYDVIVQDTDTDTLIYAEQNLTLGEGFNIGQAVLNQTVRVTYFHQPTGNSCANFFLIADEIPPTFFDCNDTIIDCTVPFGDENPDDFPPTVQDNCLGSSVVTVRRLAVMDCQNTANFPDTLAQIIFREFVVFDPAMPDMRDTCIQQLRLRAPDLDNIVFPADATVDCSLTADPAAAGQPTIDGMAIPTDSIGNCQLSAGFTDLDTVANCSANDFFIQREWTVIYWCDNTILQDTQVIMVADMTAPALTCPADFTVGTATQAGDCGASFLLPQPTVADDCSQFTVTTTTSFGGTGFGPFNNVPPGMQTATYTAEDECGNSTDCTVNITIVDDETPTPVCEEFTNISLSSEGTATVSACVFDANNNCNNPASYDDCSPIGFEASLDNVNFSENITFGCAQAGQTLNVFLRVFETFNPASATVCMVNVEIEDSTAPQLACPLNPAPVDCESDYSDLSIFGMPAINENCSFNITADSIFDISQCGDGTITRTFSATDPSGNTSFCSQVITVENSTPFDGTGINFPADYVENNTCRDPNTLSPAELNPNYLQDIFPAGGTNCAMLAVSYDDMFFEVDAPSCYKIIRTWQVIDWCQFDSDDPAAGGIWTGMQQIIIMDNLAPTISAPLVIDVTVDPNDCQNGMVTDLFATATDGCNPNEIEITNDFNTATDGSANGLFPFGTNLVTFTATDGCGNSSTAQTIVKVTDNQPPTLICNDNLATDLALMGNGGMVMANVDFFVYDVFDNCTPTADLTLTFERADSIFNVAPTTTEIAFTCDDFGPTDLEIWATDASGNSEVCITTFNIQDNNEVCPQQGNEDEVMVAGAVMTEVGEEVEQTQITLMSNSNAIPDITTDAGSYEFASLLPGVDYTVMPEKDGDDVNGVTTWDLVLIIRHIQNMVLLDTPYKIIAADVNNSQTVTMADVVAIKRLILGIDEEFTANTSWRFVDMYYEFPLPNYPWAEEFPEVLQLENLTYDELAANFTAVKIGDVNDSATAGFQSDSSEERTEDNFLTFNVLSESFEKGETVKVSLRNADKSRLDGIQFALDYAENILELQSIDAENAFGTGLQYNDRRAGKVTLSAHAVQPVKFKKDDTFATLTFKAKTNGNLADVLKIEREGFRSEAYEATGNATSPNIKSIRLAFIDNGEKIPFALYQNEPNPFRDETTIAFDLAEAGQAVFTFYDAAGRVIHTVSGNYPAGKNEITLRTSDLNVKGIVLYQLAVAAQTDIKKMVVE